VQEERVPAALFEQEAVPKGKCLERQHPSGVLVFGLGAANCQGRCG